MEYTGYIWQIDDLGRIVIPKDVRRKLRIKESDAFEIYIADGDKVVFRKIKKGGEDKV